VHTALKHYKIDHISKKNDLESAIVTKKTLSDDDRALFRQSVGQVSTIKNDKIEPHRPKKQRPSIRNALVEDSSPFVKSADHIDSLSNEDKLSFLSPGMQKNVLRKLRKGHYGLDADLDLHGLTSQQARQQLVRFLHDCVEYGCRCVHIIHGKGYRSENYHPVLKNDVNVWLRQHKDVLAFCSSPPRDGGTGAVYVLLRLSEKYQSEDEFY
jgi:DNA-nicking Smr family endonuclease